MVIQQNENGEWVPAVPVAYPWPFHLWIWKRLTGWRDAYGRKAQL
jgi:hypothetical protein